MIKIIGIILVVSAATKIGFVFASRLEKRKSALLGFKHAFSLLESEIGFAKNTMTNAFASISRMSVPPVSRFFETMCEQMSAHQKNTQELWCGAVDEFTAKMCLTNEDVQVLKSFCAHLGKSDVENELKNIYNTTVSLNMQIAKAQSDCDTNKKMYQSAGVLCGILIAVLLL